MDQHEIHYKMSKKVAQLTKVIFHLNTRNDEADQHLAAVTEAYEKEIELILQDANAKVRKIATESAQNETCSKQIEALRSAYDDEKQAALKELHNVRSVLDSRETKNLALWSERVTKFNSEVQALRQQATRQAAQFKAGLLHAESNFSSRTEELTVQQRAEIARLDRKHDEQLQEQARERDAIEVERRKAFERDLEDERRRTAKEAERCRELEEQLAFARRQMEEGISEGSDALCQANQRNDQLAQELKQQRTELERAHEALAKDAVTVRAREEEIGALIVAAEQAEQTRKVLCDESDALRRQLQENSNQLRALRLQYEELQRNSAQNQSAREASTAEERCQLQEQIRQLMEKENALRRELADGEAAQAKLREAEMQAQERIGSFEAEVTKFNKELEQLRHDLQEAMSAREEAAKQAAAELTKLDSQLESQQAEVRRLEVQLAEQAADMRCQLEETGDAGNKLLDSERAAHSEALANLRTEHEGQLSELRTRHDFELQQIKAKLAQAESARQQDGDSSRKTLEERERELRDLRNELSTLKRQLTEAGQKAEEDMRRQQELETQFQQARSEAREEVDRLQGEHTKELMKLLSKLEVDTAQIAAQHTRELDALRKELQTKLSAQEQTSEEKNRQFHKDLWRAQQDHETEVQELKRQMSELGKSADAAGLSASAQLEQLKAKMQREVEQVRIEGIEMVQRLSQQHQDQLTEMTAKQSIALDQLREKLSKTHQDRVDEMREKRKVEIEEHKQIHAKQVQELVAKHETVRQQIQREHDAAMRKLEEAAKSAAKKHADEIQSANEALNHAQGLFEQSRKECENLGSGLRAAEEELQRFRAEMKAAEERHRREVQKQEDGFSREKRGLKEQHKADLERLLEEQILETRALQEQFDRARRLQESQIELLQSRVTEFQELYDLRPSREEDLARIAALEAEVAELARAIEKLVEDMKFYKLELVNREHNYNKVFGAAPTVGVMNPVAAKRRSESGAPPAMRLVQQPGGDLGLPPLGPGGVPLSAGPGGQRSMTKHVSSRNLR